MATAWTGDASAPPPPAAPAPLALKRPAGPDLAGALGAYRDRPSPEAADRYLAAAAPVIGRALKAYAGADTPVLRARAKQIALGVAPRYDPARAKPETYLLTHLQSLRRYGASLAAPVRVPDQVRLDGPRIDRHAAELALELGRDPSDAELADRTGLPVDRVARARGARAAFVGSNTPEGLGFAAPAAAADAKRAWVRYLYHDVDPIDQLILEHTLGLHGKPVLGTAEIARKVGRTAGAVSQRKARLDAMLADYGRLFGG